MFINYTYFFKSPDILFKNFKKIINSIFKSIRIFTSGSIQMSSS